MCELPREYFVKKMNQKKRRTTDDFGVEWDADEMRPALCGREINTEDSRYDRPDIAVHGRPGRVSYRHLQVAISSRRGINCSHTRQHSVNDIMIHAR